MTDVIEEKYSSTEESSIIYGLNDKVLDKLARKMTLLLNKNNRQLKFLRYLGMSAWEMWYSQDNLDVWRTEVNNAEST